MDFKSYKSISIPEGKVTKIQNSDGVVLWKAVLNIVEAVNINKNYSGTFTSNQYGYSGFTNGGQSTQSYNLYKLITHTDTNLSKVDPDKVTTFNLYFNTDCGNTYKASAYGGISTMPTDFYDGLYIDEVPMKVGYNGDYTDTPGVGYIAINLNNHDVSDPSGYIGTTIPATSILFKFNAGTYIDCCNFNGLSLDATWTCNIQLIQEGADNT